ncbi:ATP-binding protein [Streptomyces sp. NPDC059009]|uniref:ATP-binding protein n=1 Tax=Streptomyces sp. NPDC059009 TaxID=3346694 RepID=UPI0036C00317
MSHEDENRAAATTDEERETPPGEGRSGNRIDIDGDAAGPVIAGNHNVVVDADRGSTVTLLVEGERPRPVRRPQVALLPRRQTAPLGRDAELEQLAAGIRDGGVVQVWGPAGVGKSALLRHAARTLTPGPDGVLFLDAARREPEDLAQDIFEACYETRGYAPSGPELRHLMSGITVTAYIDSADLTAEGLCTLMDAAPDATFVLGGRRRTLLGDGSALRLAGIDREAGLELLARELGRGPAPEAERDRAAALWEAASGCPLLLLRAAALSRLGPAGETVLPRPGEVADLLPLLFDRLDGDPLRALYLLATFRDAVLDPDHVGALSAAPDAAAVCARLAGLGLAERTEAGYRVVPDVVPALQERGLEPFDLERISDHFTEWIARPATTADQVAQHARALELIAELAEQAGRPELAVRIVRAASPALARSLRFGVWGRLLDLGLPAAQRAGDRQAAAYFTHEQGIRKLLTGNRVIAAVLLGQAVVLWRQLGDLHGAHAAASAQQYAPPPSGATPPTPPHTDGGAAQGLTPGGGPDPASAHAGSAHAGSAHGAGAPVDPGTAAQSVGTPVDPGTAAQSVGSPVDPGTAAHGAGTPVDPGTAAQSVGTPVDPGTAAQSVGTPVDPGTAAQTVGSPVDPSTAVHSVGTPVDPGTAAHSAGIHHAAAHAAAPHMSAAAATGTAGAAGTAAAGTSVAAAAVLKVVAVIVAVVIGGIAVQQAQDSGDSNGSTSSGTGLAGVWRDSNGGTYEFKETGTGSYSLNSTDICGNDYNEEFTGSDGTYSGDGPLYDLSSGSCGSLIGKVTVTITLGSGGDTAELSNELPPGSDDQGPCEYCGTATLTRQS